MPSLHPLRHAHLELTGRDRVSFLHNFCTQNIKSLAVGQGCEAFLCNVKGRVLGHVTVFVAEESLWLETVAGAAPALIAHLDRYLIREDVQFHDRSDELAELCFVGSPAGSLSHAVSEDLAAELTDVLLAELPPLGTTTRPLNGVWLRRVDWLLQPAYLLLGSPPAIEALQARLLKPGTSDSRASQSADAGTDRSPKSSETSGISCQISQIAQEIPEVSEDFGNLGVVLGTAAEWEALRIDAGFPAYGVDITDEHLPQEVGRTAKCISFTKGCYLGQEPIARLDAMGHTNRELRRLLCDGTEVPAPGTELRDLATDQVVGQITSAARNPHGVGAVALGYLKSKWTTPGTHVRLPDGTAVVRPPEARG